MGNSQKSANPALLTGREWSDWPDARDLPQNLTDGEFFEMGWKQLSDALNDGNVVIFVGSDFFGHRLGANDDAFLSSLMDSLVAQRKIACDSDELAMYQECLSSGKQLDRDIVLQALAGAYDDETHDQRPSMPQTLNNGFGASDKQGCKEKELLSICHRRWKMVRGLPSAGIVTTNSADFIDGSYPEDSAAFYDSAMIMLRHSQMDNLSTFALHDLEEKEQLEDDCQNRAKKSPVLKVLGCENHKSKIIHTSDDRRARLRGCSFSSQVIKSLVLSKTVLYLGCSPSENSELGILRRELRSNAGMGTRGPLAFDIADAGVSKARCMASIQSEGLFMLPVHSEDGSDIIGTCLKRLNQSSNPSIRFRTALNGRSIVWLQDPPKADETAPHALGKYQRPQNKFIKSYGNISGNVNHAFLSEPDGALCALSSSRHDLLVCVWENDGACKDSTVQLLSKIDAIHRVPVVVWDFTRKTCEPEIRLQLFRLGVLSLIESEQSFLGEILRLFETCLPLITTQPFEKEAISMKEKQGVSSQSSQSFRDKHAGDATTKTGEKNVEKCSRISEKKQHETKVYQTQSEQASVVLETKREEPIDEEDEGALLALVQSVEDCNTTQTPELIPAAIGSGEAHQNFTSALQVNDAIDEGELQSLQDLEAMMM